MPPFVEFSASRHFCHGLSSLVLHFHGGVSRDHLAGEKGLALDPSEITLALFGRHLPAGFVKMLEHRGFAFSAEPTGFGKCLFDFGGYGIGCGEQLLHFRVLVVNTATHSGAFRKIGIMQLNNRSELAVRETVFVSEPGEFGMRGLRRRALNGGRVEVNARVSDQTSNKAAEQD